MKRNWVRKIAGGLSFASILFIFQACYGTPQDLQEDMFIEGQVKSKATGLPLTGIKVSVNDGTLSQFTGTDGKFSIFTLKNDTTRIFFEDIDSGQNGTYQNKDTLITGITDHVVLNVHLDPK